MNKFYGFRYDYNNGALSDSIVTDEDTMNAIPGDRHSVGDVPIVVRCMECDEYMVLNDKEAGNPLVGEFVCPTCGRSISQYDVFTKMSEEANSEPF